MNHSEQLRIINDLTIVGLDRFIQDNFNELTSHSWELITTHTDLPEWFIERYREKLAWEILSYKKSSDEDFMYRYEKYLDWNMVSHRLAELSNEFIHDYAEHLNWAFISREPNLTFDFILMFAQYIVFSSTRYVSIFQFQKLVHRKYNKYKHKHMREQIDQRVKQIKISVAGDKWENVTYVVSSAL